MSNFKVGDRVKVYGTITEATEVSLDRHYFVTGVKGKVDTVVVDDELIIKLDKPLAGQLSTFYAIVHAKQIRKVKTLPPRRRVFIVYPNNPSDTHSTNCIFNKRDIAVGLLDEDESVVEFVEVRRKKAGK